MPDSSSIPPSDPADRAVLEELLVQALELLEQGGGAAVERLLVEHPALAPRVRSHLEHLHRVGLAGDAHSDVPARHPERLGDFRIVEPLGQGGMGVVYRAVQESLGREVALKLIRPDQLFFPGARERFRREVELVARMQHPGIVPIHAVGSDGGIPYFAMELVRGASLADVIQALADRDPGQLTGADLDRAIARCLRDESVREPAALFRGSWPEVVLRIVREVAEALEHAHRRSVLHRDVKPSNVMLTRDGRVLLLDFGLAGAEGGERVTRTGSALGSLAYMPPEVLAGLPGARDARGDVYSLGATCWELLALQLPYQSSDPLELRALAGAASRPKLATRNPAVSWEVETVVATAMEPDPTRRYATAQQFARDLDNVLAHRPIEAREASTWLRLRRWTQRHPARATAVGAFLFVLVGAPSLWAWQERQAFADSERQRGELQRTNVALDAERGRAQANFDKLLEAVDTMLTKVGDQSLRDIPRMEVVRSDLLGTALRFYEGFLSAQPDDPRLRVQAANVRVRVAEVQALLGDYATASREIAAAIAVMEQVPEPDEATVLQLARSRGRQATALRLCGELPAARAAATAAIAAWQRLGDSPVADVPRGLGEARMEASLLAGDHGDLPGALAELETSLAEIEAWQARHPGTVLAHLQARTLDRAAVWVFQLARQSRQRSEGMAKLERALAMHQQARTLWDGLADRPDVQIRSDSAQNLVNMSLVQRLLGRAAEAKASLEGGVQRMVELVADFPAARRRRSELASARGNLSALLGMLDDLPGSIEQAAAAQRLWAGLLQDDPKNDEYATGLAHSLQAQAVCHYMAGKPAEGVPLLQRAGEAIDRSLAIRPDNPTYRVMRRKIAETEATLHLEMGAATRAAAATQVLLDARFAPIEPLLAAGLLARAAEAVAKDGSVAEGQRADTAASLRGQARQLIEDELQKGGKVEEWRRDRSLEDQWKSPAFTELVEAVVRGRS